jgi:NitT/TauT family transport system permease protein
MSGDRRRSSAAQWSAFGAIVLIGLWELLVRLLDVRPFVLLAPSKILSSFVDDPSFYLSDTWVTARHLVFGVLIALAISLLMGAALAAFRPLEHALQPLLVLIMVTPWVAYITSIRLATGPGTPTTLFLTAFVTTPAFVYATVGGMRGADPAARELFASIDASRWEVLWRLRLPSALPSLFTAARFNVGLGLGAAYFAEGSGGGRSGLGESGRRAAALSEGAWLWTTILCAALLGIVSQVVLVVLERWLLRWHHSHR